MDISVKGGSHRKRRAGVLLVSALLLAFSSAITASALPRSEVRIVASLPAYASIAEEIVGDRGTIQSIADPRQDAHFVLGKPSFAIMLSRADLLLSTGLDLEMWMPPLIDKSRNPRIRSGEPGYVSVSTTVPMLQVPANPNRAGGDIHIYGNPHIHTDPLRAIIIAENVNIGLHKIDAANGVTYDCK
ncbi:MAG: metal ABC transporter substrate-binding protein [Acidobacteriota bacterium]